jgi:DNA-binding MarR family transcriptional regulator/N-acetylglutamate synthase-like GNAT family acetyltransferase
MSDPMLDQHVAVMRGFNRFYTRLIGVLQDGLLQSPFSLAELRVLYELAHRDRPTATELAADLALDGGYLSRILRALTTRRLVRRTRSADDGRQTHLSLTKKGETAFAELDARAHEEVRALLRTIDEHDRRRLVGAMALIERLLGASPTTDGTREPYLIRPHQPGDMGWIVHRHGVLYSQEYGWDERFEALVAGVVATFIQNFDPKRERCWIAEQDGEIVGSIFLVQKSRTIAKLRLLYVEPRTRGMGIGRRLVTECIRFARQVGYRKITLWTNSNLDAARHLYVEAGFVLVDESPHHSFGATLVGQTWELSL